MGGDDVHGADIDLKAAKVNFAAMDIDDLTPRKKDDALTALIRQDLDPLSVDELRDRITALEAEIGRTRTKLDGATKFRSAADSLFKK